jgi:hypothetical protein
MNHVSSEICCLAKFVDQFLLSKTVLPTNLWYGQSNTDVEPFLQCLPACTIAASAINQAITVDHNVDKSVVTQLAEENKHELVSMWITPQHDHHGKLTRLGITPVNEVLYM